MSAVIRLVRRFSFAAAFWCSIVGHGEEVRARFETVAGQIAILPYASHAMDDVPRRYASDEELKAVWDRVRDLLAADVPLSELEALSRHENAKVRTLALLGLIKTEERAAVPLIHNLINDDAATIPNYFENASLLPGEKVPRMPMTVGKVAKLFLQHCGYREYHPETPSEDEHFREWRTKTLENPDWIEWYSFLYRRSTSDWHGQKLDPTAKTKKLQEMLARVRAPLRAWCLLEWTYWREAGVDPRIANEEEVIGAAKDLGGEALVDYLRDGIRAGLKGQRDPERRGQYFILRHARRLFARKDVEALVKLGQYIAAAELAPENASKWLRRAMSEWKEAYRGFDRGRVMAALLELCGDKEAEFIATWFAEVVDQRGGENPLSTFFTDVLRRRPKQWKKTFRLMARAPEFTRLSFFELGTMARAINEFSGSEVIRVSTREEPHDELRNGVRRVLGVRELPIATLQVPGEIAQEAAWSAPLNKGVFSTALSGGGKLIAVGHNQGGVTVLDANSGQLVAELPVEGDRILVHFKQGTDQLLTLSSGGVLNEWSPESWRPVRTLRKLGVGSSDTAFRGDGERIVGRGTGVIDTVNARRVWRDERRTIAFGLVAFSPNGERVAMCDGASKTIELFSAEDGRILATLRGHTGVPTRACFSPDSRWIASMAQDDDRLILWDGQTGAQKRIYAVREHSPFLFTADSNHFFATPCGASAVATFDCETSAAGSGFDMTRSWPGHLLVHPDGVRVFATSAEYKTREDSFMREPDQWRLKCWVLPARAK